MRVLVSPMISGYRMIAASGAVCKINGEVVPCEKLWEGVKWLTTGAGIGVVVAVFAIGIVAFFFWFMMLVHAIKNPIEHKPIWILVLLLTGLIGAIIYYFAVKRASPLIPSPTSSIPPTISN